MAYLYQALTYPVPFLAVLSALIFVHEMGHYLVARVFRVRVQVFSIGFGRELLGRTDRRGTRWKLSLLPLGGYVRMGEDFDSKPVRVRAAVMIAGPAANFLFAIIVFATFFAVMGERVTSPQVAVVLPGSPAETAGIRPGDTIMSIDRHATRRWEDISESVLLHPGDTLSFVVRGDDGAQRTLEVAPKIVDVPDTLGGTMHDVRIGIRHLGVTELVIQPPARALLQAVRETCWLVEGTLRGIWQTMRGARPPEKVSGVISAARMSKASASSGMASLIYFAAFLSVNIGLANLLPMPMLDGGNLAVYALEAATGKPAGEVTVRYSMRFGILLLSVLAVMGLWNDLGGLRAGR